MYPFGGQAPCYVPCHKFRSSAFISSIHPSPQLTPLFLLLSTFSLPPWQKFEDLDVSLESFLQDNINAMMNCIDELSDEAAKYYQFKDTAARNEKIATFYREFKESEKRAPNMRELQEKFPDQVCAWSKTTFVARAHALR